MGTLDRCHSIADLRRVALRRLPWPMREFLEGGSDDEWTLANNRAAFNRYSLVPRSLCDVTAIDTSVHVLGQRLAWPVMLAPTGMTRMYHGGGEVAVARAAANTDTVYALSTYSSQSIEQVREVNSGPRIFQLFSNPGWEIALGLVERAAAADYSALCYTVDTTAAPNKERDYRTGVAGSRAVPRSLLSILRRPRWVAGLARGGPMTLANLGIKPTEVEKYQWREATRMSWDKLAQLRARWRGPLLVKGILSVEDARRAVDEGVDGIVISNHGGRQMDCVPAPIDLVEEFAAALQGRADIIVDSGFRRGSDVLKALALGASAVMVGRAYLYGLAAGGEAGVVRAITLLREEIVRDMRLMGLNRLSDIDAGFVRREV
ncbi:MAG: alpha-hydroxy acid oxidase [Halioglobus sp.]|nr:alpha-hydroxy acid oxidase [Halioglobus sp.]